MTESIGETWLRRMVTDIIQGCHLGDTWWVMVASCLKDLDEDEFETIGADAFIKLRGQVHWIRNPAPTRAVIECLLSLPWDEPNPLSGDVTLIDEYCRTLADNSWDSRGASAAVLELARLNEVWLVVKALDRYLKDENQIFDLLKDVDIGHLLFCNWGDLDEGLCGRLLRANRLHRRVEMLRHFLAFMNAEWNAALELSPLLDCCRTHDSLYFSVQDYWLSFEVDFGVLSEGEMELLGRLRPCLREDLDPAEDWRIRREVYEEVLAQDDPISWLHKLPESWSGPSEEYLKFVRRVSPS